MFRRFAMAVSGVVLALSSVSAVSAGTSPISFNFRGNPLPVVGSQLSNSTLTPLVSMKDGWTVRSPNGIGSAEVLYNYPGGPQQVWSYPPTGQPGGADKVSGMYQWTQGVNEGTELTGQGTDEMGNRLSGGTSIRPSLADSSGASYGPGWRTARCKCYTGGQIRYSTRPGATATYRAGGKYIGSAVSFVSDTGPTGGEVALTIKGHTEDVSLTDSTNVNRVIVWDGKGPAGRRYILTVKVISGRVDVEGFITNQP